MTNTDVPASALTREEDRIRTGIRAFWEVGDALRAIRDGALYNERGFVSFKEYCESEWAFTDRQARYLIDGAMIYELIVASGSPIAPTHLAQTRPLKGLPDAQVVEVWQTAASAATIPQSAATSTDAPAVAAVTLTAKQVAEARDRLQVEGAGYPHVTDAMNSGTIVPSVALLLVTALESCREDVRQFMTRAQVMDATVIREMNRLATEGRETYSVIAASGYIQFDNGTGMPISKAKAFDLRRMLDEARAAHIATNTKQLFVGLYPDDPFKSYQEIQSKLGHEFLQHLIEAALSADVDLNLEISRSG